MLTNYHCNQAVIMKFYYIVNFNVMQTVLVYVWLLQVPVLMEFRSQRGRGSGDSHGYSSSSRRHEEKPMRPKRRTADDDRSSHRHSRAADTHKVSSVDSTSKESSADSRRATSEIFKYWHLRCILRCLKICTLTTVY